jgi:hypothetical protein
MWLLLRSGDPEGPRPDSPRWVASAIKFLPGETQLEGSKQARSSGGIGEWIGMIIEDSAQSKGRINRTAFSFRTSQLWAVVYLSAIDQNKPPARTRYIGQGQYSQAAMQLLFLSRGRLSIGTVACIGSFRILFGKLLFRIEKIAQPLRPAIKGLFGCGISLIP